MKIAFTTNGKNLKVEIALHFGRAKNFLIYDTETKTFDIYPNPEFTGGFQLPPDFLHSQGVNAVVAFSLGPMAFEKLKKYNIKMFKAEKGSIAENLEKFKKNQLKNLSPEDIF